MRAITTLRFAGVKTSGIGSRAATRGYFDTMLVFVGCRRVEPVVNSGPLRVARVEFVVGEFTRVGRRHASAAKRFNTRSRPLPTLFEPEARQKLAGGVSHRILDINTTRPGRGAGTSSAMPSTHLSLHYHIIFSTKDRVPSIAAAWRERLHAYLGGVVRNDEGVPEAVGGVADHVHLLVGLRATACLADVVRDVKAVSSRWVHEEIGEHGFAWQEGYGAFTVGASQVPQVRDYIAGQEEHHRKQTFQDEYVQLLKRSGVDYDERYLW